MLAGGLISGLVLADPATDELPNDSELEVFDPDDQLTNDDIHDAIELAVNNTTVAEKVEKIEPTNTTVQATGDRTDVKIILTDDHDGVLATVDLQNENVTRVVDSVSTATESESFDVFNHSIEGHTNETIRFNGTNSTASSESADTVPTEMDVCEVELSDSDDGVAFNATDDDHTADGVVGPSVPPLTVLLTLN